MDDPAPAIPTPPPVPAAPSPAALASPVPSPAPRRRPAARPPQHHGNVKETIEQILVAFILAFVFRCFVVEAFVIPTGSMAPTLLGAHINYRCPDCGWHWAVNYSGESDGDDVNVPSRANETFPIRCPNCGFKLPRAIAGEPDNGAAKPPVKFGDRILVQKYIYLLHPPRRWDVVVFKTPDKPDPRSGVEPYTQNYIKRLVGRPNETIMILDGDIYAGPADRPVEQLRPSDFVVQTKPKDVQDALWRVVYDSDYRPKGLSRTLTYSRDVSDPSAPGGVRQLQEVDASDAEWRDPWMNDAAKLNGWNLAGRDYRFDNAQGTGALRFDPSVAPEKHPLTDWLGYDVTQAVRRNEDAFHDLGYDQNKRDDPLNFVSDLKLAATYQRTGGDGSIRFNLTKLGTRFTAELTPTELKLWKLAPDTRTPELLGSAPWSPGGRLHPIEFENVDYRVALRVDGREVLATTPQQYAPDVPALLAEFEDRQPPLSAAGALKKQQPPSASVEAERQACTLKHLALWRDVYYLNRPWSRGPYKWGIPTKFPTGDGYNYGRLIRLGPDEYFTMGDNSMMSADARVWTSPVYLPQERLDVPDGRVPGRFMLGRAFFVYWPSGYAPLESLPAFVPNFGEMRFIH